MKSLYHHLALGIMIAGVALTVPSAALAAVLFVSPSTGNYSIGQTFPVVVRVNTKGVAINAIQGTLSFNPALMRVVSLSSAGSIFNLSLKDPAFSNTAGTITWAGLITNPGYTGNSGMLFTIVFKAAASGQSPLRFTSELVLANDGKGTTVPTSTIGGSYHIGTAVSPPTSPLASPSVS